VPVIGPRPGPWGVSEGGPPRAAPMPTRPGGDAVFRETFPWHPGARVVVRARRTPPLPVKGGGPGGPLGLGYAGTRLELDRARPATAHPGCAHPSSPGLWPRAGILSKSDPARGRMPLGVPARAGAAWDEAPCHVRACPVDPERRPGPLSVLARAPPFPLRGPPLPPRPFCSHCAPSPPPPSPPLHALIGEGHCGLGRVPDRRRGT
jgi:hypothetical protein